MPFVSLCTMHIEKWPITGETGTISQTKIGAEKSYLEKAKKTCQFQG